MSDFTRDFVPDLEVRSDGEGRTIHGIVVPWDSPARVSDGGPFYTEVWQRGAFTKHLNERTRPVKLLSQHDRDKPMGVSTLLREDAAGLYGEFKVSNTRFGNDQLELVRDGALDSFSVGFKPVKHVKRDGVVVRTEAGIREVSLVTFPAFDGALVAGVRSEQVDLATRMFDALADLALVDDDLVARMADVLAEADHPLTSLAQRLDAALAAGASATPSGAGEPEPREHSGRLMVARNNFRAALIERGIK